jgi:hypothetical protein
MDVRQWYESAALRHYRPPAAATRCGWKSLLVIPAFAVLVVDVD